MTIDLERIVAIDVHTHAEVGRTGEDGLRPEWREAARKYFGEGGTPTVEDVAACVAWLLGGNAGFITGEAITLDGGMTRKMIYLE